MERRIVAVSQLNAYIKNSLDSDFLLQNVWVKGEISNFKLHYSGHMYFSLKDDGGVLKAVMFKNAGALLRFKPENGMQVLARGRISVFPRDGAYQLYVEEMEPEGVGALYIAFEQMKSKLAAEGLFSQERKKPIPTYPKNIGIVTSATGAAVQDILNILQRRWPLARIMIYPVLVQGEGAAQEIARAIDHLNADKVADVLIVGRGGGSQEDLWAFNEESVARAVAESKIPIISAVGHEIDFTICDFVADLRAPTPSAAAELAVPDVAEVRMKLSAYEKRLSSVLSLSVSRSREQLTAFTNRFSVLKRRMDDLQYVLDGLTTRAVNAVFSYVEGKNQSILQSTAKLDALSPLKVLTRGYAVASKNGEAVRSVDALVNGDVLSVRFADGTTQCTVQTIERSE